MNKTERFVHAVKYPGHNVGVCPPRMGVPATVSNRGYLARRTVARWPIRVDGVGIGGPVATSDKFTAEVEREVIECVNHYFGTEPEFAPDE